MVLVGDMKGQQPKEGSKVSLLLREAVADGEEPGEWEKEEFEVGDGTAMEGLDKAIQRVRQGRSCGVFIAECIGNGSIVSNVLAKLACANDSAQVKLLLSPCTRIIQCQTYRQRCQTLSLKIWC